MACPTCDHTMQNVGAPDARIFWCPRCGTISTFTGEHRKDEPTLWMKRVNDTILSGRLEGGALTVREHGGSELMAALTTTINDLCGTVESLIHEEFSGARPGDSTTVDAGNESVSKARETLRRYLL